MAGIVYLNGDFIAATGARIDPADRGFTLGDGVFDTMRSEHGVSVEARAHFDRLHRHAGVIGIDPPVAVDRLIDIAGDLLRRNDLGKNIGVTRTTVTRGPAQRGLACPEHARPTLLMQASVLPASTPPRTAILARTTRRNEWSPLARIKSLQYGDHILALAEAKRAGADEALLMNTQGHAVCATSANLFALIDGRWLTPPLADGIIDGITRASYMRSAGAEERSIGEEDLNRAETIVLTNSLRGAWSLESLDGRVLRPFSWPA